MKKIILYITEPLGLHARPAGLLAKECLKSESRVEVLCKGNKADGKSVFGIMELMVTCGDTVEIIINGTDENNTYQNILNCLKENSLGTVK